MTSRLTRTFATTAGALLLLTACSEAGSSDTGTGDAVSSTAVESAPSTAAAPEDTSAAAPVVSEQDGPCPYLEQTFVKDTVGQNIQNVVVTVTTPAPGPGPKCEFVRPNGEVAASIDTLTADSEAAAQAAALEFAPGGNPVKAGEGGSVLVKNGQAQTLLGAYQGTTVVFVTINQESSLQAGDLAAATLAALG